MTRMMSLIGYDIYPIYSISSSDFLELLFVAIELRIVVVERANCGNRIGIVMAGNLSARTRDFDGRAGDLGANVGLLAYICATAR